MHIKDYKTFKLELRGRYIFSGFDFETRSMVMAKFIPKNGDNFILYSGSLANLANHL